MGCAGSKGAHRKVEPVSELKGGTSSAEGFTEIEKIDAGDAGPGGVASSSQNKKTADPSTASSAHDSVQLPGAIGSSEAPTDVESKKPSLAPVGAAGAASPAAAIKTAEIIGGGAGGDLEAKKPAPDVETKGVIVGDKKASSSTAKVEIEARPPIAVSLVPIEAADEADLEKQVQEYLQRVPEELAKAVGMSKFVELKKEMLKDSHRPGAKDSPKQWLWIGIRDGSGGESYDCDVPVASTAGGLLVFRILRLSFSNSVVISHVSAVPGPGAGFDAGEFGALLHGVRNELFGRLNITNLRLTLNYYEQGGETGYAPNRPLESLLKKAGFRWFQLINHESGTRGQVMNTKRLPTECEFEEDGETMKPLPPDDEKLSLPSRLAHLPADEQKSEEEEEESP
mmetsp:Transcript_2043/g.4768  ORF Transcript_2043/g.4768 Transcript_2043/m.4768 type:complete len:397 (-) Transcript_2043:217-1407(-)|eukprot:CAMPEP_0178998542 /NCGR_PEP_ID=MMETSP0795-20121207/9567_1 /TAXON_ID=88552 /ORGANISM="Amoebophrya sp., Strain Ameob2" /LENGTH=396 /DNA_ID=CAMNT_0020691225 /DNA_START=29 /DNA_END=1219 /DNA_ORIENTATION=-